MKRKNLREDDRLASRSIHPGSITSGLFFVTYTSYSSKRCYVGRQDASGSGAEPASVRVMRKRMKRNSHQSLTQLSRIMTALGLQRELPLQKGRSRCIGGAEMMSVSVRRERLRRSAYS